jgi:hypothetical protein
MCHFYFLSDVGMLSCKSGVRLLTKMSGEDKSIVSSFIYTEFKDEDGESVMDASKAKDLEIIKDRRNIFHMKLGAMYGDELVLDKEGLMKLFDRLIACTEGFIKNHLERKLQGEYINHLTIFNDKEGLIRTLHSQTCFRRMKLYNSIYSRDKRNVDYLLLLIQKKITAIKQEKAKQLYQLTKECVKKDNALKGYKLSNAVLKRLLSNHGVYSDEPYFFTSSQIYNKFRNNKLLKKRRRLTHALSHTLNILHQKNYLETYKKKINNHAPVYFLKKKRSGGKENYNAIKQKKRTN